MGLSVKAARLSFSPSTLKLKYPFSVAWGTRETTPIVLLTIEYESHVGYGEASMPPYLGETVESVCSFLKKIDTSNFTDISDTNHCMAYVNSIDAGNYAAKAAVDIALHDLKGKLMHQPVYEMYGLKRELTPLSSFTVGMGSPSVIESKLSDAVGFKIIKVKLGGGNDREMIETVKSLTNLPLIADVNQGWKDRLYALDTIYWLKDQGVIFVEQPMPGEMGQDLEWLISNSPLPVYADEAIKTTEDLKKLAGLYNGVNIKLMKCGGLISAVEMAHIARKAGMGVMIGCMTETSCAVTAAAHISPLADIADLDGNILISNDIYTGAKIIDGKVEIPAGYGLGLKVINEL